eukprot:150707_1
MGSVLSTQQQPSTYFWTDDNKECTVVSNPESKNLLKELKSSPSKDCVQAFYLLQSRHQLTNDDPVKINVNISADVETTWKKAIKRAIKIIIRTCPGIDIVIDKDINILKQIFIKCSNNNEAYTQNNLILYSSTTIVLGTKWNVSRRNGTALHELLHALGVQHEHKRNDGHKFGITLNEKNCIKVYGNEWDKKWKSQFSPANNIDGITVFDPHSIMNYVACNGEFDIDNNVVSVYSAYCPLRGNKRRDVLSPLDEIGLNLLYKPCRRKLFYNPVKNDNTMLYYCGRVNVTKGHDYPSPYDKTDGNCGPNNGANCTACRVLKNDGIMKYNDNGDQIWQGSSGMFYCGKKVGKKEFGHDGYCGPNNGPSCDSCHKLIE